MSLPSTPSTRRTFLEMIAGCSAIATAGCLSQPPPDGTDQPFSSSSQSSQNNTDPTTGSNSKWPQFGGNPRNTGYIKTAAGPGITTPELGWRYDAGTPTMNTSPVVSEGTVFAPGSGDPGLIHAIDLETGNQIWQFKPSGYASSAPALADGTLYIGTWGKKLYAIDADSGEEQWSRDIGHRFGSSSPVVVDDTVFVGTIGDGPLVVSGEEDEEEFEACAFLAMDADTGELQWQYRDFGEKENIHSSPAVADDRVFFGAETAVYALDIDTGDVVWTRDISTHPDSSPAVVDGTVYYGAPSNDGSGPPAHVWALDAASGETLWTSGIDDTSLRISPAVANSRVYVPASSTRICTDECYGETRGRLYALDADSGDRQWMTEIKTDTRSSPAVADGMVYVGCRDGLSAVTTEGENAWRVSFEGERDDGPYVKSSPAVADGHVFIGASDGRLRAIRAAEPK